MITIQVDQETNKIILYGLSPETIGAVSISQLEALGAEIATIKDRLTALEPKPVEETEIPGWNETTAGWPGEVRGTFGEERLRKVLTRIDNNNGNITMHFINGSVLTLDGWYGLSEEEIVTYIGI